MNRPAGGQFPTRTQELHHEVELVLALGEGGREIAVEQALDHVFGYARRPRHDAPRHAGSGEEGRPPGGHGQGGRPVRAHRPDSCVEEIGHPTPGAVWLRINGELHQEGDLEQQVWKVPETISYLSTLVALRAGDPIMTGTPKGIGRVEPGDHLHGHIDGAGDVTVTYDT